VGSFHAGEAPNVIPDTAQLGISLRTSDAMDREFAKQRIEEIVSGVSAAQRASAIGVAGWLRRRAMTRRAQRFSAETQQRGRCSGVRLRVRARTFPPTRARYPGCFIFLGGGDQVCRVTPIKNHHPKFDINESSHWTAGVKAEVQIALNYLSFDS
jgi:metal-dependent amidase/aminoacylase/carboxypeptidase family protein